MPILRGAVAALALAAVGCRGAAAQQPRPAPARAAADTAVFAGGCFWGVEAVFEHLRGVTSVTSGFAGGTAARADYRSVSTGRTGHAESVRVVYDPARITYRQLLEVFFGAAHDPTQLNRQGPDVGTQYRSAIFFRGARQRQEAEAYVSALRARRTFRRPIVTEISPLREFHQAEAYHQDYLARHPDQPYIVVNDLPKLHALRARYPALYRS